MRKSSVAVPKGERPGEHLAPLCSSRKNVETSEKNQPPSPLRRHEANEEGKHATFDSNILGSSTRKRARMDARTYRALLNRASRNNTSPGPNKIGEKNKFETNFLPNKDSGPMGVAEPMSGGCDLVNADSIRAGTTRHLSSVASVRSLNGEGCKDSSAGITSLFRSGDSSKLHCPQRSNTLRVAKCTRHPHMQSLGRASCKQIFKKDNERAANSSLVKNSSTKQKFNGVPRLPSAKKPVSTSPSKIHPSPVIPLVSSERLQASSSRIASAVMHQSAGFSGRSVAPEIRSKFHSVASLHIPVSIIPCTPAPHLRRPPVSAQKVSSPK